MVSFEIGDLVRVAAARRRDITYRVSEVTPLVVVAVSDRGEARYAPGAFELIARPVLEPSTDPVETRPLTAYAPPAAPALEKVCDSTVVCVRPDEPIDSVWRRFKKACEKAGIPAELRRRRHFIPKSAERRNKAIAARIRRSRPTK